MKLEQYHREIIDRTFKVHLSNSLYSNSIYEDKVREIIEGKQTLEKFFEKKIKQQSKMLEADKLVFYMDVPKAHREHAYEDIKRYSIEKRAESDWVLNKVLANEIGYQSSVKAMESEFNEIDKKSRLFFNKEENIKKATDLGNAMKDAFESLDQLIGNHHWNNAEKMEKLLKREDKRAKEMKWEAGLSFAFMWTGVVPLVCGGILALDYSDKKDIKEGYFKNMESMAKEADNMILQLYPNKKEVEMTEEEEKKYGDLGEVLNEA